MPRRTYSGIALRDKSQSLLSQADELDASPKPARHAVAARLPSDDALVIATVCIDGGLAFGGLHGCMQLMGCFGVWWRKDGEGRALKEQRRLHNISSSL
jgi:hypothetical protein